MQSTIGVERNFDWGVQTANYMQWGHQKFLNKEIFVGQRYRRMEDQKPGLGLVLNQDFAEGKGLKLSVRYQKCIKRQTRRVKFKPITDESLGAEPLAGDYGGLGTKLPATRRFFEIFWKKNLF